jgi:hypothetical protein
VGNQIALTLDNLEAVLNYEGLSRALIKCRFSDSASNDERKEYITVAALLAHLRSEALVK